MACPRVRGHRFVAATATSGVEYVFEFGWLTCFESVLSLAIFGNFIPLGPATKPLRERIAEWIRGHVRMLRG